MTNNTPTLERIEEYLKSEVEYDGGTGSVKLERLRRQCVEDIQAIREGYVLVPKEPTEEILQALDEWQPIETAPDDEDVLVLCGRTVIQAFHDNREDGWCLVTPKRHKKYGLLYGFTFGEDIKPTHWMPLPEPPQNIIRDKGE